LDFNEDIGQYCQQTDNVHGSVKYQLGSCKEAGFTNLLGVLRGRTDRFLPSGDKVYLQAHAKMPHAVIPKKAKQKKEADREKALAAKEAAKADNEC